MDSSNYLNLFLAFFLLTSMLFINLMGEQLAALVCIEKVLTQFVSLLTKAVERSSHHAGLSLKIGAYKSLAFERPKYILASNLTCIVSSPAWTVG